MPEYILGFNPPSDNGQLRRPCRRDSKELASGCSRYKINNYKVEFTDLEWNIPAVDTPQ